MGHLLCKAGLLDGGHRVSSSDDGDAAGGSQFREGGGDSVGALGEGVELEHYHLIDFITNKCAVYVDNSTRFTSHRAVPDDSLAVRKASLDVGDGLGSDVQTHPAFRDSVDVNHLVGGVRSELVSNNDVACQEELHAFLGGDLLELSGEVELVVLNQGFAHRHSSGLQKCENHATAEDKFVHLVKHGLNNGDLGGHLTNKNCKSYLVT